MIPVRAATALLLLALAGGCAAVKKAEEPKVMRLAPAFSAASPAGTTVTSVAPVLARGVAGERRYAYIDRAAPAEMRQAATLFWEEAPPKIVERALVNGLRTLVGPTTGSDTVANADQRLIARLERFEEVTGGGQVVEAVVVFDVTVLAGAERRLRLTGRYCGTTAINGDAPTDRARAFESALSGAVTALAGDLRSGAATPSRAC